MAENKSAYIYFGGAEVSWIADEYPGITAIDAFDAGSGLWNDTDGMWNPLSLKVVLLLPIVSLTDTLTTKTLKVPISPGVSVPPQPNDIATIPLEFNGGVHFSERPSYQPSDYGIQYLAPSPESADNLTNLYNSGQIPDDIFIGPAVDNKFIDNGNNLYGKLEISGRAK